MEIWNRRQAELQYDWDVADFEIEEVRAPRSYILCVQKNFTYSVSTNAEQFLYYFAHGIVS